MDGLMNLPKDLLMSEIFERLDKPEIHILSAVSPAFQQFLSAPEFLQGHSKRGTSPTWLFTHFATADNFHCGLLKCSRVEDLKEITFNLDELFKNWVEMGDEVRMIGADGNLVLFILHPEVSLLVLNPFSKDVYHIKCPTSVFSEEWFTRSYVVDILQDNDDFNITFVELVGGVPQYIELTGKEQIWTKRDVSFVENISSLGDQKCITISSDDCFTIYKLFLGNGGKELFFIRRPYGIYHLIAALHQKMFISPEEPRPGWFTGWTCNYSCNGWCVVYQTVNHVGNQSICRLRKLFLFKIRDGISGGDLYSYLDTELLMPDSDYVIMNVCMREIQGSIYIAFQTNSNNALDTIVTTVFHYDVQQHHWRTKRIGNIRFVEIQKPVFTSRLAVHNRDCKIVWPAMVALANQQKQKNHDMKMKYLEKIIDSQPMVIQYTTNANESEFGELQQDESRKPDSKIAEVEGGFLLNKDPGEKSGTVARNVTPALDLAQVTEGGGGSNLNKDLGKSSGTTLVENLNPAETDSSDSKIAEVEGGFLLNKDPGKKSGTVARNVTPALDLPAQVIEGGGGSNLNKDLGKSSGTTLVENLNPAETDSKGTAAELKEKSLLKDICESSETIDEYRNPVANLTAAASGARKEDDTEQARSSLDSHDD